MSTFYEQRPEKFFLGEMTHSPFPPHVHEVVEIVALEQGSLTMDIGNVSYPLKPGDIAMIFPFVPHSYVQPSPDVSGLVAIFPRDLIAEFISVFYKSIPGSPVLKAEDVSPDVRLAIRKIRELPDPISSPFGTAYLHVMVAGLLADMPMHSLSEIEEPDLGYRIIQYASMHACEQITLESTARALGINVSHLSHFFSQKIHINFRRFINALRIDKARQLMRDPNMTLTTVSGMCGFNNMRTFRRAFWQETGTLPSSAAKEEALPS